MWWNRSIRFYLLSEEEQRAAGVTPVLQTAQLHSRHWYIHDSSGEVIDEIHGDGVVGQQPIMEAGSVRRTFRLIAHGLYDCQGLRSPMEHPARVSTSPSDTSSYLPCRWRAFLL